MRVISAFFILCIIEKHKKFAKESFTIIIHRMNTPIIILAITILILIYSAVFFFLNRKVSMEERKIVDIFLLKISKIPALIEVMRPYVVDEKAFDAITALHSEVMIHRYEKIYDLLEYNARIEHEFLFLMKLSMQIPTLQKDEYFLYIRDFIIQYERNMHNSFNEFNKSIFIWNSFVTYKNYTWVGLILPWSKKIAIH